MRIPKPGTGHWFSWNVWEFEISLEGQNAKLGFSKTESDWLYEMTDSEMVAAKRASQKHSALFHVSCTT